MEWCVEKKKTTCRSVNVRNSCRGSNRQTNPAAGNAIRCRGKICSTENPFNFQPFGASSGSTLVGSPTRRPFSRKPLLRFRVLHRRKNVRFGLALLRGYFSACPAAPIASGNGSKCQTQTSRHRIDNVRTQLSVASADPQKPHERRDRTAPATTKPSSDCREGLNPRKHLSLARGLARCAVRSRSNV